MNPDALRQIAELALQADANNPQLHQSIVAMSWDERSLGSEKVAILQAFMNTPEMTGAAAVARSQGWSLGVGGLLTHGAIVGIIGGAGCVWDLSTGTPRGAWFSCGSIGLQLGGGVYVGIYVLGPQVSWDGFCTGAVANVAVIAGVGILGLTRNLDPTDSSIICLGLGLQLNISGLLGARGHF